MTVLLLTPAVLCLLVFAAHWLRYGAAWLALGCLLLIPLLLLRRAWVGVAVPLVLTVAALEWVRTTWLIAQTRGESGQPWGRAAAILLGVAALNALAALLFRTRRLRSRYGVRSARPEPHGTPPSPPVSDPAHLPQ